MPKKTKKKAAGSTNAASPKTIPLDYFREMGRRGGRIGGKRRAQQMTAEERKELARKAAMARWAKK
jgi:hypothetical protein